MSNELSLNQIPNFIKSIDAQLAALKSMKDTPWKTQGKIDGFENLKEIKTVEEVLKALSSVKGRAMMYDEVQKDTTVKEVKEFTYNGNTYADWLADANYRIAIITEHETRERLLKAKEKATTLLSDEDKKRIALMELQDLLGTSTLLEDKS